MSKKAFKYEVMKGQMWHGRIADDIIIKVVDVQPDTNTVRAFVLPVMDGDMPKDYVLDTFNQYYKPVLRPVHVIAREIDKLWKPVWFGAVPYLQAMHSITSIDENYGLDSAESVVLYFLGNAAQFKGPDAKRIKQELKYLCSLAK